MCYLRLAAASAFVLLVACADLKDVATFADALQTRYHMPTTVLVNNGTHLVVTFRNAPATVVGDSAHRAAFAHDVAVFAKHAYPHSEALKDVTVAFAAVRATGPVTLAHTDAPYRWTMTQLP